MSWVFLSDFLPAAVIAGALFNGGEDPLDLQGVGEGRLRLFMIAQRGDEVPVPNDVYIVNDNTTIRDVPIDPSTELLLIDWNECCETSPGAELDAFASAIGGPDFVEIGGRRYAGSLSPYWVTIENGQVVLIEEQFLP